MRAFHSLMRFARGAAVHYDYVPLKGGLDQITPSLSAAPGVIRDSQNFEVAPSVAGGYSRIAGYERYDGRPSPSSATYTLVQVTAFVNTPVAGQTLTGATSGATGVIIAVGATYIALTKIVGNFSSSEVVMVGATTIGTATTLTATLTALVAAQYTALAADSYRDDIEEVPGSGPVRGVVAAIFDDVDCVYAFRDNAAGTAVDIYQATTSGWTLVPFFYEVSFTVGSGSIPAEGATLTQGAVTTTLKRIVLESGSWASGDAAGRFIVTAPSGGNFTAAALTGGASATLSGVQTAITLTPGGTYEFDIGNFSGQASTIRIYGCDGVNRGFEFDGEVYVPIRTGATTDAPTHVKIHKTHLMWALGSSIIHSAPGLPYNYVAASGASEMAVGDTITNFIQQPGATTTAALGVTTVSNTHILYGSSSANWNLVTFNTGVGGVAFTARLLNQSYWLDSPGVVNMYTSQNYGDFGQSTITNQLPNLIEAQQTKPVYAVLNRAKSQYRLLYNDGVAIYTTILNGKVLGSAKIVYADAMYCAWNSAAASSDGEWVLCGAKDSGYVYRMDKGSSFDGEAIDAHITLNWNNMKSPRLVKRFRRASVEISGNFYASIFFGYKLGYNSTGLIQPSEVEYATEFGGASNWDGEGVTWDSFSWDGVTIRPTEVQVRGSAVNIQTTIRSATNYINAFTISSLMFHYSPRRGVR